ncbi:MAG: DEAD/DEAH box helicase, partial [Armatimonadetes bacterium]|nr:DEAD/DEAH box helicase [Armatimonadota bacterium]
MTSFDQLNLVEPLLDNLTAAGYERPTPIQAQAIPPVLEGADLLGCAQTGTGKTAAFALPILQRFTATPKSVGRRACRALVLVPTRELAVQVGQSFAEYGRGLGLRHCVIHGGVGYGLQTGAVARGIDIVVATPGRLLDLINQGSLRLWEVEVLVLDEADRMLDMGFIHDIREILACVPRDRQTMFFSATMAGQALKLAEEILTDPVKVSVVPSATPVELVEQQVMYVASGDKRALLSDLLQDEAVERVLVFTRTKHGASRLARQLHQHGFSCEAIHGDKSQYSRQQSLEAFRDGTARVLVATDVAARGIDVDGVTHVINYDLPLEPESYVHRIGRTGRAGAAGTAVTFCSAEERGQLRDVEQLIRQSIPVVDDQPYH